MTAYRETIRPGWVAPLRTGRPPDDVAPPAQCEALTTTALGDRQCESHASWLVPEAPYCQIHMPNAVRDLAALRRARWAHEAADLWGRIMRETAGTS